MKFLLLLIFPCLLFSQGEKDSVAMKYAETITSKDLKKHLYTITGDDYEGRETGMEGQKKAAAYIASQFNSFGIDPYQGSYFQKFPLVIAYSHGVSITDKDSSYQWMRDYFYYNNFGNMEFNFSSVVYAGYGISDERYDDYKDIDVNGKVVIIREGEIFKKGKSVITGEDFPSDWSVNFNLKHSTAQSKGAKVVFVIKNNIDQIINNNSYRNYLEEPKMLLKDDYLKQDKIPVIYISNQMANQMLFDKKNNNTLSKIDKKARKSCKSKSKEFELSNAIKFRVNRQFDELNAENVVAFIEGSDLKDEIVVVTAHYDHLGVQGDKIFNGADDDGSGTVAVLEIAEAFQKAKRNGEGPRRSVLVMTVSGEEKGLLGSKYYSDNPIFPLENTVADLNIDMIGRIDEKHEGNPNYIYLIGSDILSQELHDISENTNTTYTGLELDYTYNDLKDPNRFYYRSDHYNFAKHNIPVIFYFNGVHEDYHQETDTVEKIDFDKMEVITRLVFYTAWKLVNRDDRIELNKK